MKSKTTMIILLSIYLCCLVLVCLLWENPSLLTACFFIITILLFIKYHEKSDIVFYFVAFVLGPLGEFFAILFGSWSYANPFFFIPTWLPLAWGIAILLVKKISETILATTGTHNPQG
jgi:uncharacterized membrane protein YoaT (DUF817 family)